mgnify:CR=1 FL=1
MERLRVEANPMSSAAAGGLIVGIIALVAFLMASKKTKALVIVAVLIGAILAIQSNAWAVIR